jgi:hypothetical protein
MTVGGQRDGGHHGGEACGRDDPGEDPAGAQPLGDPGGGTELRILAQDRALERLQLGAGLESELRDPRAPGPLVALERVDLPPRAVQRHHELGLEALVQGVALGQPLELTDEGRMAAE